MSDPSRFRVAGPLKSLAAGFAAELCRQGYTPNSAGLHITGGSRRFRRRSLICGSWGLRPPTQASRARRPGERPALPDPHRHDAQPRRAGAPTRQARGQCRSRLSVPRREETHPHVLRHTAAMRLLHAGVDTSVIALWLGHEQIETTQIYLQADLVLKEQALTS